MSTVAYLHFTKFSFFIVIAGSLSDTDEEEDVIIAKSEPELYLNNLRRQEVFMLFQRAKLPPNNNDPTNIVHCCRGQVYIFNKEDGDNVRQSRRHLGECDGLIWKNCGTIDNHGIHVMYSVAVKEGEITNYRRTIYWHNSQPHALIHYRGEYTGSSQKKYSRGRRRVAVHKYEAMTRTNFYPKEPLPGTTTGPPPDIVNIDDFQPARTCSTEEKIRLRAESRPVQGSPKFQVAVPFSNTMNHSRRLTSDVVTNVLNNTPETQFLDCSVNAISSPKHGDLFLFNIHEAMPKRWDHDILKDGFKWCKRSIPQKNSDTFIARRFFLKVKTPEDEQKASKDFQKMVYYDNHSKRIAIHYFGSNDALANGIVDPLHAERLVDVSPDELEEEKTFFNPAVPNEASTSLNMDIMASLEGQNLKSITTYLGNSFVRDMQTDDTVSIQLVNEKGIDELKRVIAMKTNDEPLTFHYDTNFVYGDYHVSILSMQHPLIQHSAVSRNVIKGLPTIPISFHIHREETPNIHGQIFLDNCKILNDATSSSFDACKKIAVVDQKLRNDIPPNTEVVYCWNSVLSSMKERMKKMGLSHLYQGTAVDVYQMAKSDSIQEFEEKFNTALAAKQYAWSIPEFAEYFSTHQAQQIRNSSGKWLLQDSKMPFTDNGVSNNSHQDLQRELTSWLACQSRVPMRKSEISNVVMACKLFSDDEITKTAMAYYNKSPAYMLRSKYSNLSLPSYRMPDLRLMDPAELSRTIKVVLDRKHSDVLPPAPEELPNQGRQRLEEKAKEISSTSTFDIISEESRCQVIDKDLKTFSVKYGDSQSCSCETVGYCPHILAVNVKLGLNSNFAKPAVAGKAQNPVKPNHPRYALPILNRILPQNRERSPPKKKHCTDPIFQEEIETFALNIAKEITPFIRPDLHPEEYNDHLLSSKDTSQSEVLSNQTDFQNLANFLHSVDETTWEMRLGKDSLRAKMIPLEVGQVAQIEESANNRHAMKNISPGKVVLFSMTPSDRSLVHAAKCVQHQVSADEVIQVKTIQTDSPMEEVDSHLMEHAEEDIGWQDLKTICHCREPTPVTLIDDLKECTSCNEKFHAKCLPNHVPENFSCAACTLPTAGAKWSAGAIQNTCTIDNALTSIILESKDNPALYRKIRGFKYASTKTNPLLKKSLGFAMKGQWGPAQETWNTLRLSQQKRHGPLDTVSLEGTPEDNFYNLVKEGGSFRTLVTCKDCRFRERSDINHIHSIASDEPLRTALKSFVRPTQLSSTCKNCKTGTLEQQPLVSATENDPWFLHFDLHATPYKVREVIENVPKTMSLDDGTVYKLGHITLSTPGHFSSILLKDNQFLYYDGIREDRITKIPNNIIGKDYSDVLVQSMTYLWSESN